MPDDYQANDALRLAVGLASAETRPVFAAVLSLDQRLSMVAKLAQEPVFAQMRLAWWRDELALGPAGAVQEPLLAALREAFGAELPRLIALVDGWEAALVGDGDAGERIDPFIQGRADAFALVAQRLDCAANLAEARRSGELWALALLSVGELHAESLALAFARGAPRTPRLPRRLRPLALLGALSARALRRGGGELLGDRLSPFAALRIALIGR